MVVINQVLGELAKQRAHAVGSEARAADGVVEPDQDRELGVAGRPKADETVNRFAAVAAAGSEIE